jgi:hypothetical protein
MHSTYMRLQQQLQAVVTRIHKEVRAARRNCQHQRMQYSRWITAASHTFIRRCVQRSATWLAA